MGGNETIQNKERDVTNPEYTQNRARLTNPILNIKRTAPTLKPLNIRCNR